MGLFKSFIVSNSKSNSNSNSDACLPKHQWWNSITSRRAFKHHLNQQQTPTRQLCMMGSKGNILHLHACTNAMHGARSAHSSCSTHGMPTQRKAHQSYHNPTCAAVTLSNSDTTFTSPDEEDLSWPIAIATQRRVTACLDHLHPSEHTLRLNLSSWNIQRDERRMSHLPRRYWKNPVTRFRDVVFFTATSLNWAIVLVTRPFFLCALHVWKRAHVIQGGKQISCPSFPSGGTGERALELSVWKHWVLEDGTSPSLFPLLSLSLSLPLALSRSLSLCLSLCVDRLIEGSFFLSCCWQCWGAELVWMLWSALFSLQHHLTAAAMLTGYGADAPISTQGGCDVTGQLVLSWFIWVGGVSACATQLELKHKHCRHS